MLTLVVHFLDKLSEINVESSKEKSPEVIAIFANAPGQ